MKIDEALTRDIMALNVYSMEMNDKIPRAWASSSTSCTRSTASSRSSRADSVIYTKLLEEVEPSLVKWKSKTEVK